MTDNCRDNIQRSETVIARILDQLMNRGLKGDTLEFSELQLDDSLQSFFIPSIRWLEAEGVIRFEGLQELLDGYGCVNSPVLTSRGFALLNRDIELGGERERLGAAVKKVSAGEAPYWKIGDAIGGLLGGFTKSLGG